MVSKASDDFPEPLKPVITTSLSRGMFSVRFFRLCSRAPPILMKPLLTNQISVNRQSSNLREKRLGSKENASKSAFRIVECGGERSAAPLSNDVYLQDAPSAGQPCGTK